MSIDISIIVPTYNRKENLKACLDSFFAQDYPKEGFEIVVVNDDPNDEIARMTENFKEIYPNLKYFTQYHRGPARARNLGIENSSGNIIGFVDDDCVMEKRWIRSMVDTHQRNSQIAAVGGLTYTSSEKMPVTINQFLSTCSIEIYMNGKKEVIFFPTCNVSLKKGVFDKFRFNENFPLPGGEDLELFWRLFKEGHRFIWNKDIIVTHYRNSSLSAFMKQAYIYGRGNFLVQHMHKDHPLLKDIKTGKVSFCLTTVINILKIPRFSYFLGKRFIKVTDIRKVYKQLSIYLYFILHKIFYITGNIVEFFKMRKSIVNKKRKQFNVPYRLILDITHSCNLSCRICDIWQTKTKDMDIYYIKKMLSQAKDLGIKEIALSGGEPLLRKDIFEIIEYAKQIKIKHLGLLSNGILVEKHMEKLAPYLIDNTISPVISLDTLKPDVHNYIRNSDIAWQKTMQSLNALSLLKKEHPQINFDVITIILDQNLEELPKLAAFVKTLGVNSLQFQAVLSNNLKMAERKRGPFWVSDERLSVLDKVINALRELKKEKPGFIKNSMQHLSLIKEYYRGTIDSNEVNCLSAHKTVLISNHGECTTCFSSYGDIKRTDLKDVLKGSEIIRAREKVKACSWPCMLPCFCDL